MLLIFYFLGLFAESFAQVNEIGSCPYIQPRNFSVEKILGSWFEYARIPNTFEQPNHVCVNGTFYIDDDHITLWHVDATIRISGAWYIWEGQLLRAETNGVYNLKYPWYATLDVIRATFVDGNWDHWMITHVCSEQAGKNQQIAWVWTKTPYLEDEDYSQIEKALARINLSWIYFEDTDNTKCPIFRAFNKLPN